MREPKPSRSFIDRTAHPRLTSSLPTSVSINAKEDNTVACAATVILPRVCLGRFGIRDRANEKNAVHRGSLFWVLAASMVWSTSLGAEIGLAGYF